MEEISGFTASEVIQMLLADESLAGWATSNGINTSLLYNVLAGHKKSLPTLEALALRLRVPVKALEDLVQRPKTEFLYRVPQPPVDVDEGARSAQASIWGA